MQHALRAADLRLRREGSLAALARLRQG